MQKGWDGDEVECVHTGKRVVVQRETNREGCSLSCRQRSRGWEGEVLWGNTQEVKEKEGWASEHCNVREVGGRGGCFARYGNEQQDVHKRNTNRADCGGG